MKTFVVLSALLAVAISGPLPLVQVIVNVESNQASIVDDGSINDVKPEPALPEVPEESEVLPAPADLPEPVFPELPKPENPEESEDSASEESEVSASEESQVDASEEQEAVAPLDPEVVAPEEPEFFEEEILLPHN